MVTLPLYLFLRKEDTATPRIRNIKPEFFFDPELAAIGTIAQLFFIGLWCQADKAGRMKDESLVLKAKIFPYKDIDTEKIISELTPKFLTRYTSKDGKKYIQINTFSTHQRPHHTEQESILPSPTGKQRCNVRSTTTYKGEGKGDGDRKGEGKGKACVYSEEFETFYQAYPRKVEKSEAFKAWQKHTPDLQVCLKAVAAQIASGQLNTVEPKFILYPERWIKREKWNDEIIKQGGSHGISKKIVGEATPEPGKYAKRETIIKGD